MYNYGERLLAERKRLGLNQEQMAAAGQVAKRTYCNYESGEREPGAAFLEAIAAVGADVRYILTGVPSAMAGRVVSEAPPGYAPLTSRQKAILDLFTALDERGQREILDAAEKEKQLEELKRKVADLEQRSEGK